MQRREESPGSPDAALLRPCPSCGGDRDARERCGVCRGLGAVRAPHPRTRPPAGLAAVADVLRARALIERHGVAGWMALEGVACPHPLLAEALAVFEARLEAWERRERVAEARAERMRRMAAG